MEIYGRCSTRNKIKEGIPEIEVVNTDKFGKEETNEYEMEIWIPVT